MTGVGLALLVAAPVARRAYDGLPVTSTVQRLVISTGVRARHDADGRAGAGSVALPFALASTYPRAA